ncbi:MAG: type II toxin-antitoxin system HicB family antitoxin [Phycisphaerae bacterium]
MKIAVLILTRADGQYVAHCPALPGCVARADSRESAEHKMRDAVAGYLASLDVPSPPRMIVAEVQETVRE